MVVGGYPYEYVYKVYSVYVKQTFCFRDDGSMCDCFSLTALLRSHLMQLWPPCAQERNVWYE